MVSTAFMIFYFKVISITEILVRTSMIMTFFVSPYIPLIFSLIADAVSILYYAGLVVQKRVPADEIRAQMGRDPGGFQERHPTMTRVGSGMIYFFILITLINLTITVGSGSVALIYHGFKAITKRLKRHNEQNSPGFDFSDSEWELVMKDARCKKMIKDGLMTQEEIAFIRAHPLAWMVKGDMVEIERIARLEANVERLDKRTSTVEYQNMNVLEKMAQMGVKIQNFDKLKKKFEDENNNNKSKIEEVFEHPLRSDKEEIEPQMAPADEFLVPKSNEEDLPPINEGKEELPLPKSEDEYMEEADKITKSTPVQERQYSYKEETMSFSEIASRDGWTTMGSPISKSCEDFVCVCCIFVKEGAILTETIEGLERAYKGNENFILACVIKDKSIRVYSETIKGKMKNETYHKIPTKQKVNYIIDLIFYYLFTVPWFYIKDFWKSAYAKQDRKVVKEVVARVTSSVASMAIYNYIKGIDFSGIDYIAERMARESVRLVSLIYACIMAHTNGEIVNNMIGYLAGFSISDMKKCSRLFSYLGGLAMRLKTHVLAWLGKKKTIVDGNVVEGPIAQGKEEDKSDNVVGEAYGALWKIFQNLTGKKAQITQHEVKQMQNMHSTFVLVKDTEQALTWLTNFITSVYESFYNKYSAIPLRFKIEAELKESIRHWCERADRIFTDYYKQSLSLNVVLCSEVVHVYKKGQRLQILLMEAGANERNFPTFFSLMVALSKIQQEANSALISSASRKRPVHVWLCGDSHVGKSHLSKIICMDIMRHRGMGENANQIYLRDASDQYWSGYTHPVGPYFVVVDDAFQLANKEFANLQALEILNMVNTQTWPLNMANLPDKGNTFFNSSCLITTTNLVDGMPLTDFRNIEAILNRRDIIVKVELNQNHISKGIDDRERYKFSVLDRNGKGSGYYVDYPVVILNICALLEKRERAENILWQSLINDKREYVKEYLEAGKGKGFVNITAYDKDMPVGGDLKLPLEIGMVKKDPTWIKDEASNLVVAQGKEEEIVLTEKGVNNVMNLRMAMSTDPTHSVLKTEFLTTVPMFDDFSDVDGFELSKVYDRYADKHTRTIIQFVNLIDWSDPFTQELINYNDLAHRRLEYINNADRKKWREHMEELNSNLSTLRLKFGCRQFKEQIMSELKRLKSGLAKFKSEHPILFYMGIGTLALTALTAGGMFMYNFLKSKKKIEDEIVPQSVEEMKQRQSPVKKTTAVQHKMMTAAPVRHYAVKQGGPPSKDVTQMVVDLFAQSVGMLHLMNSKDEFTYGVCVFAMGGREFVTADHFIHLLTDDPLNYMEFIFPRGSFKVRQNQINTVSLELTDIAHIFVLDKTVQEFKEMSHHLQTNEDLSRQIYNSTIVLVPRKDSGTQVIYSPKTYYDQELEYPDKNGGKIRVYSCIRVEISTFLGMCASPYLSTDTTRQRKLLGFHVAGSQKEGWGALYTQEMEEQVRAEHAKWLKEHESKIVPQMFKNLKMVPEERIMNERIIERLFKDKWIVTDEEELKKIKPTVTLGPGQYLVGILDKKKINRLPTESRIQESLFYPVFEWDRVKYFPTQHPARLGKFDKDGETVSPLQGIITRSAIEDVEDGWDLELIEDIARFYYQRYKFEDHYIYDQDFTMNEIIAGRREWKKSAPMNTKSSMGLPAVVDFRDMCGKSGKRNFMRVEMDGTVFVHPQFIEYFDEMLEFFIDPENATPPILLVSIFLKDELRPNDRVDVGKTRGIQMMSAAYQAVFRYLFAGWMEMYMENTDNLDSVFGIDVHSIDWTALVRKMNFLRGWKPCDGDLSGFDYHQYRAFQLKLHSNIYKWYEERHEKRLMENAMFESTWEGGYRPKQFYGTGWKAWETKLMRARYNCLCILTSSIRVAGNVLFIMNHGNITGEPITAQANGETNQMENDYAIIMYWRDKGRDMSVYEIHNHFARSTAGDDLLHAVDPLDPIVDNLILSEALPRYSRIGYTSTGKGDVYDQFQTLETCTILKRRFRKEGSYWVAPLQLDVVLNMLMFKLEGEDPVLDLQRRIFNVLTEAFYHGPDIYQKIEKEIRAASHKIGIKFNIPDYKFAKNSWNRTVYHGGANFVSNLEVQPQSGKAPLESQNENPNVTQVALTKNEDSIEPNKTEKTDLNPTQDDNPYDPLGVEKMLSREYPVTVQWTGAQTFAQSVFDMQFPKDLIDLSENIAEKLGKTTFFRADIHCRVILNGNPQLTGCLLISRLPCCAEATDDDPFSNIWLQCCCDTDILNANTNEGVEFSVPWSAPYSYYDLTNPQLFGLIGRIVARVGIPLRSSACDAEPSIDVTFQLSFRNVVVAGPNLASYVPAWYTQNVKNPLVKVAREKVIKRRLDSMKIQPQMMQVVAGAAQNFLDKEQDSASKGKVDEFLDKVAYVTAPLMKYPVISKISSKLHPAAEGLRRIARSFGFSKPTTLEPPKEILKGLIQNPNPGDGVFIGQKIALDPRNRIANDPNIFSEKVDYALFENYKLLPALIKTFSYNAATATEAIVATIKLAPTTCHTDTITGGIRMFPTPLYGMSYGFRYWRGGLKFYFVLASSTLQTSRTRFSYFPPGVVVPATLGSEAGDIYTKVVDVIGTTVVKITIPYLNTLYYCQIVPDGTKTYGYNAEQAFNTDIGTLVISIVNKVAQGTCEGSTTVTGLVFMSGAEDFQVAVPREGWPHAQAVAQGGEQGRNMTNLRCIFREPFEPIINCKMVFHPNLIQGEVVSSFYSLCKRFSFYTDFPTVASRNTYFAVDPKNVLVAQRCQRIQMWVDGLFHMNRGSTRWLIMPYYNNLENEFDFRYHIYARGAPRVALQLIGGTFTQPALEWPLNTDDPQAFQNRGFLVADSLQRRALEVELPFYDVVPMRLPRFPDGTSFFDNDENLLQINVIMQCTNNMGTEVKFQVLRSIGEDYSWGHPRAPYMIDWLFNPEVSYKLPKEVPKNSKELREVDTRIKSLFRVE